MQMNNMFLIYLLIIHILSDYYLQTDEMAQEKRENLVAVIKHGFVYGASSLILMLPFMTLTVLSFTLLFSIVHLTIDLGKFYLYPEAVRIPKLKRETLDKATYIVDQSLHLLSIIILAAFFSQRGEEFSLAVLGGANLLTMMKYILMVLLVMKPVNITFRVLFSQIKPESNESEAHKSELMKVGKTIGSVERILTGLLLSVGQYAAIGLIFTAKSITRYDKISKDQHFAEYYLLGTLYSMLATVICYLTLFNWIGN